MAVEDMRSQVGAIKVEVVVEDHQNKPDIGLTIVKRWFDVDKVDAVRQLAAGMLEKRQAVCIEAARLLAQR